MADLEQAAEEVIQESEVEETPKTVEEIAEAAGWNPNWEPSDNQSEEDRTTPEQYLLNQQKYLKNSSRTIEQLKENYKSLEGKLDKVVGNQANQIAQVLEAQRLRLMGEREKAVEEGDTAAFNKADKELSQLGETPDPKPNNNNTSFTPEYNTELEKYITNNPWVNTDIGASIVADGVANKLRQNFPGLADSNPQEFFNKFDQIMRQERPMLFATPTNKPTQLSSDRPPKKKSKSAWDAAVSEYPELEQAFQTYVDQGLYVDGQGGTMAEHKEKYAKSLNLE